MPVAKVIAPGFQTTVQDLGRFGYRHLGVPVSGGIDKWALRLANRLVGNDEGDAALEMTMSGPTLLFLRDCVAAITGADMAPQLSGQDAPMWQSFFCSAGDILSFSYRRTGCRAYLAISGGVDVPPVLGSRSTFLAAGFGGLNGRPLQAGDLVKTAEGDPSTAGLGNRLPHHLRPAYLPETRVKVIAGINADRFSNYEYTKLFGLTFTVTRRLSRMGCFLDGPDIKVSGQAG
ncbi:MAG: 5-oxoprolinase subunit C family protein, partial [Eubacteriales bacterium]